MLDEVEESLKVIVVGDGNVGKTSMLKRFCKNDFTETYKKTIGAEYMEKEVYLQQTQSTVKLMLWDTAGQEVFNALTASYYRGAAACVLAFSTSDVDSYHNVAKWKQKVEDQCGTITMVVCQTKVDLIEEFTKEGKQHISTADGETLAAKLGLPYFPISTKKNYNVTNMFESAAARVLTAQTQERTAAAAAAAPKPEDKKDKKDKKDKADKKEKKEKKEKDADVDTGDGAQGGAKPVDLKAPKGKQQGEKKKSGCSAA
jgi:small GTP-binding protein